MKLHKNKLKVNEILQKITKQLKIEFTSPIFVYKKETQS